MRSSIRDIEFYTTPTGDIMLKQHDQPERVMDQTDREFIQAFLEHIREFYKEAYNALMELYLKSALNRDYYHFIIVSRFIRCNFGLYDNHVDIDPFGCFRFEFVSCPLRGWECKMENRICNPLYNSTLSPSEYEVMKLLFEGRTELEVADILSRSPLTIANHKKNSYKKLRVHTLSEFMRLAAKNQIFKS